jgi:hypothetical protein
MVMSAPVPDWIADVMRDCRSLALIVSRLSVMPVALAFLRDPAFEQHVGSRHEIGPAQPMNIRPLRVGRCASGG